MLYLEDFLELIEHLPGEVLEKCTTVRELDLSVQNTLDTLNHKADKYFSPTPSTSSDSSSKESRDAQFTEILKSYDKALEDADEKIQLTNQLYTLIDRYAKRLDQDLTKFKMELEADNAGITEHLEAKVAKQLAEEESLAAASAALSHSGRKRKTSMNGVERKKIRSAMGSVEAALTSSLSSLDSSSEFNDSLSASREMEAASSHGGSSVDSSAAARCESRDGSSERPKRSSLFTPNKFNFDTTQFIVPPIIKKRTKSPESGGGGGGSQDESGADYSEGNSGGGGGEQRWCICNDFSYGNMIGCDNKSCEIEWFHYSCVGITAHPTKKKWYCPRCRVSLKKKNSTAASSSCVKK